jgi:hypothetical protein
VFFDRFEHRATPIAALTTVAPDQRIRIVVAFGQHFSFFSAIGANPVAFEFHFFFVVVKGKKKKKFASTSVK